MFFHNLNDLEHLLYMGKPLTFSCAAALLSIRKHLLHQLFIIHRRLGINVPQGPIIIHFISNFRQAGSNIQVKKFYNFIYIIFCSNLEIIYPKLDYLESAVYECKINNYYDPSHQIIIITMIVIEATENKNIRAL